MSKYLGGDIQHTHLVKGLDYALLSRQRAEIQRQQEEAAAAAAAAATAATPTTGSAAVSTTKLYARPGNQAANDPHRAHDC